MNLLSELQKVTLQAFFAVPGLRERFYLTGGTALSVFYLEHRLSDDLDFFTHTGAIDSIERVIEDAFRQGGLKFTKEAASPSYRRYLIEKELKVDIVKDVEFRIGSPRLLGGFMIDDPQNIAVNKVTAVYGRLDPKDYCDLYFLKPYLNYNILDLIHLANKKDGGIEPFHWARIIRDVETFQILPRMVKALELKDLKIFFYQLRDEILDSIKP